MCNMMSWRNVLVFVFLIGEVSVVLAQTDRCDICAPPSTCASSSGQVLCICQGLAVGETCEDELFVPDTIVNRQNGTSGTILSPNYPQSSGNGIRYFYHIIQVPGAVRIRFQINFFCTELNKDFLFYGSGKNPSLDVFPGNLGIPFLHGCNNDTEFVVPDELELEGDSVWFRFDADRNIESPGFNITYNIVGNAPIAICPNPVVVESLQNDVGNIATWANPTCTGIDQPDPSIFQSSCNPESGGFFSGLGSNDVTCTCTDNLGSSGDCTFTVTIIPFPVNNRPVIACPGEVRAVSRPNNVGNVASWTLPTCTDIDQSPNTLQISCQPPSGSLFPLGRNAAVCTCTDDRGGTSTCNVRVTITEDPSTVCDNNPCGADECRPNGRTTGALYTCHELMGNECQP